MHELNSMK